MINKKSFLSITAIGLLNFATAQFVPGGTQYSTSSDDNWHSSMAANSAGEVYITWLQNYAGGKVYLQGFDLSGNLLSGSWTGGGTEISLPSGDYWKTNIIMASDEKPIVCWYGYSTSGTGSDKRHIFVQKFDNTGTALWNGGTPVQVSPDSACHHLNPFVTTDRQGGCVVSWYSTDLSLTPSSSDLWVQRIDNTGNVHAGWPGYPVQLASKPGVAEQYPHLAVSPDLSHLYAEYSEGLISVSLHMQMLDPATGDFQNALVLNSPVLITPGTNIYQNAGREPWLFSTGNNDAILIWVEFRTLGEIYIQKINTDASIGLVANGKKIYDNAGDDLTYFHCLQKAGDQFFYTIRENAGTDDVIHVNGADTAGTELWSGDYATPGVDKSYSKLCEDGAGGMFLFYNKAFADLEVTRLNDNGTIHSAWAGGGVTIGTIDNFDGTKPNLDYSVAYAQPGIAFTSWNIQGGDTYFDVFACNVLANGDVCTPSPSLRQEEISNEMHVWPNPFIDEIHFKNVEEGTVYSIEDFSGRTIQRGKITSGFISTGNLSDGNYILLLTNRDGEESTHRILRFTK